MPFAWNEEWGGNPDALGNPKGKYSNLYSQWPDSYNQWDEEIGGKLSSMKDSIYDLMDRILGKKKGAEAPPAAPPAPPAPPTLPPGPFGQGNIPGFNFTSYSDADYQNLPVLRYLQGRMPDAEYQNYAGGMGSGAFGTQLPLAGSINMERALEIAQNPDAADVLRSLYMSGNLNYDALVNLARARAPQGNAVPLSGIFT